MSNIFFMTQLLDMLEFYAGFEINDLTGEPMTDREMTDLHYKRIRALQVIFISRRACVTC